MARIYIQYFRNIMLQRMEYILSGAFLLSLFASVSVINIFNNMPKDNIEHAFSFLMIALKNTEWMVQAILVAIGLWLSIRAYRFAYKNIDSLKNFNLLKLRY